MKFRLNRVGKSECVNWPKPASTKVKHECMFAQSKNKIIIIKMEKYRTKVYSLRRRDQRRLHNTKGIKLSSFLRSYKSLELYDLTSKLKLWNISRFNAFHNKRSGIRNLFFRFKTSKRRAESSFNMQRKFTVLFYLKRSVFLIYFSYLYRSKTANERAVKTSNLSTPQLMKTLAPSLYLATRI